MKTLRRTLIAAPVALAISLGAASAVGAQEIGYTPPPPSTSTTSTTSTLPVEVEGVTQVQADPAVQASGTLPYTGNDSSLPLAEVGVGLLAAGGLAVVMVRRRQANAES